MSARPSTSARLLAPVALAVCAVAVLVVIGSSMGGGDDSPGGDGSAASSTTQSGDTKTTTTPRTPANYTVKSGDTLSKISKEHLGNANDYMKIFELNKDQLSDPNMIKPGQVLKLP